MDFRPTPIAMACWPGYPTSVSRRAVYLSPTGKKAATGFANLLKEKTGWTVKVPQYKDTVELV